MLTNATRLADPLAAGSNFTVMRHEAFAPKLGGQLFVSMKSVEFVPVTTIPDIPIVPVPGLAKVTFCGALVVPAACGPKLRLVAESVMAGATAVPVNDTVCGLPAALSATLKLAFFVPLDTGVKFIATVQLAPFASVPLAGQGLLPAGTIPKLLASLPVIEMLDTFSVALPWFLIVTVCGALAVPAACPANTNAAGEILTSGAGCVAVPLSGTVCSAPEMSPELSVMLRLALNVPAADGVKEMRIAQLSPAASIEVGGHPFANRN